LTGANLAGRRSVRRDNEQAQAAHALFTNANLSNVDLSQPT